MSNHLVRDAPEQEAAEARPAVGADDDHPRAQPLIAAFLAVGILVGPGVLEAAGADRVLLPFRDAAEEAADILTGEA